jgi:radical SAM superfamily enzyme YgiQ (UPF0313 family)
VIYGYPNEYTVGITSLGYQLVWAFFATHPDVAVHRLFTDAADALPASPDLLGFSFSWELDYSNLFSLLERLRIPLLASERDDSHPLVFGGGPVLTANPEPYADLFDVVLMGDGEDMLAAFTARALEARQQLGAPDARPGGGAARRLELLAALAEVPGVYVPRFYEPHYAAPDGALLGVGACHPAAPAAVQKQTYRGGTLAASTVVSPRMAWESIYMAEVVRSCPEMCRFCMASYLTLPFRAAPLEGALIPAIQRGLEVTDRIGLLGERSSGGLRGAGLRGGCGVQMSDCLYFRLALTPPHPTPTPQTKPAPAHAGASVTQHPEFPELLAWLCRPELAHVRLSIASVRASTVTLPLAAALAGRGTKSLTVAVESGSPRMRRVVNKKLAQEEIVRCAVAAQEGGLEGLKLYGMVGLPGEEEEGESRGARAQRRSPKETKQRFVCARSSDGRPHRPLPAADVEATVAMMADLRAAAPKLRLTLGCSTFVPKAHTPFQYYGVRREAEGRLKALDKALGRMGVAFRPESYKWSVMQAVLSRGDRRVGPLLVAARDGGDSLGALRRAARELEGTLPGLDYYAHRDVDPLDPGTGALPWSHLHGPLPEATLVKHLREAQAEMALAGGDGSAALAAA